MTDLSKTLAGVDQARLATHVHYLAEDPLPCRRLNYTRPRAAVCTLYEADAYIEEQLAACGYTVEREGIPVQAFRRDATKPLAHQYSAPQPEDPWYDAYNLYARIEGRRHPNEIIVVVSHKDSQSWMDVAPGAYDNAVGTAAHLELARVLQGCALERSVWFVFCNEEHTPWTSVNAAERLAASEHEVVAVLNVDSIGGKSDADRVAGRMVNVTRYTTPEGEAIADCMADLNEQHGIGLVQTKYACEQPNDDDGSFIKAGMPAAVAIVGSFPYADAMYHTEDDRPGRVDFENVTRATQLTLATLLHVDTHGACG